MSSSSSNISRAASRRSLAMEVRCSKAKRRSPSCCSGVRKIVVRFKLVAMPVHLRTDSNIYASLCQNAALVSHCEEWDSSPVEGEETLPSHICVSLRSESEGLSDYAFLGDDGGYVFVGSYIEGGVGCIYALRGDRYSLDMGYLFKASFLNRDFCS